MVVNQHPNNVLNSWKEIAAYLDRGIRTAQRWERHLDMPVHHIGKGKRSPVCAKVHELNFWLSTVDASRITELRHLHPSAPIVGENTPINNLRHLRLRMRNLSQAVAENSVRLRKETDALAARLTAMKSRITKA